MLKKALTIFALCSLPLLGSTVYAAPAEKAVDSEKALQMFSKNLDQIRASLKEGKMTDRQAMILLMAVQARQNQVIIQQNGEIIALLKTSPKDKGDSKS